MLDVSKAFGTVDSAILLKGLKMILDPDKFCLIKIMFNAKLIVWWETEESDFFKTDAGVSKGDDLNTNEFTLYLVRGLYK